MPPPDAQRTIVSPASTLWIDADEIMQLHITVTGTFTLDDAKDLMQAIETLNADRKRPMLARLGELRFATRESMSYMSGIHLEQYIPSIAYIVESPVTRMILGMFTALYRPPYTVRLFATEQEAKEWLLQSD